MRVASVDIGSNSILLLVAERDAQGAWRAVEDHVAVARISQGMDASGVLAPDAVARAEKVLAGYAAIIARLGVERVVATGTAPFRRASNGSEVAHALGRVLGTPVDIVSGDHEADLALLATRRAFPELDDILVADIGGASTELIRASEGSAPLVRSLDVGSVRLTERAVAGAPLTDADHVAVERIADAALADPALEPAFASPRPALIGVAGTVTTVLTIARGITTWDAARVHGARLSREEVRDTIARVAALDLDGRIGLPGMSKGREDVLPAGAILLERIMSRGGFDELVVSDRGTRWGRLHEVFDEA